VFFLRGVLDREAAEDYCTTEAWNECSGCLNERNFLRRNSLFGAPASGEKRFDREPGFGRSENRMIGPMALTDEEGRVEARK
jgi:hypothetical protein